MADRHKIRFLPIDRTFYATKEESILEVAMRSGVHINGSCGGNGACGRCKVVLSSGEVFSTPGSLIPLGEQEAGVRLACVTYPLSDITVTIPLESQIDRTALKRSIQGGHVLSAVGLDDLAKEWLIDPPMVKKHLKLEPPTREDNASDSARLLLELRRRTGIEASLNFRLLQDLSRTIREADWDITATIFRDYNGGWEIQQIQPGDTESKSYALAVDIGTTTICVQLLDTAMPHGRGKKQRGRTAGRILAESSDYNGQISYGEDVISRIMYAQKPDGLRRLQESVVDTINRLVAEVVEQAKIDTNDLVQVVLAGNTTMTHLLLGLDPRYLMLEPYVPTVNQIPATRAERLGLSTGKSSRAYIFPSVASYVGGDIVAGVLGSGMFQRDEITLFIDVGTNGEIVVGNREWLTCASCSAGPAFEGGGISSGVRAGRGAIEQVRINPSTFEPMLLTIGRAKPIGICGSGLIDAVSELFQAGLIEQNGRINRNAATERIREREGIWEYVFCHAFETATGKDIVLSDADIDNIMRAKAAIYAGCKILLSNVGLDIHDIERVIIAGGFGHYIGLEKAKILGLLPDIADDRFLFVGNGSLLGARLASLSYELGREAKAIAERMTNIELSNSARFMDEFVAAMFIPHTDENAFPEVLKRLRNAQLGGYS